MPFAVGTLSSDAALERCGSWANKDVRLSPKETRPPPDEEGEERTLVLASRTLQRGHGKDCSRTLGHDYGLKLFNSSEDNSSNDNSLIIFGPMT